MMDKKVKKFSEFMKDRKFRSSLSRLVIVGKTKKSFFHKPIDFELHIFFTPEKHRILDLVAYGIDLNNPKLNIDFNIGQNIDVAKNWVENNGHLILYEINK